MPHDKPNSRHPDHSEDSATPTLGLHTIVVALRCWWMVAAPIGLLLACGAAAGVAYIVKPKYTAAAWILIRARPEHMLPSIVTDDPQKFVQNQLELLRSPHVLGQIAHDAEVASIPEIAAATDPAQALRKQLRIRAQGQSDYHTLEFTSVDRERAALLVNKTAKLYIEEQRKFESERGHAILSQLLAQQKDQYEKVKDYRQKVSGLSKQLTGDDPFIAKSKPGSAEADPTSDLKSQLVASEVDHEFLKAEVAAETQLLEQKEVEVPQTAIDQYIQSNPQLIALASRLELNKSKERAYLKSSANLQQSAPYQRLHKEVADDQAALTTLTSELAAQARGALEKQIQVARQDAVADMQRKEKRSEITIRLLREKMESEIASHKELKGDLLELEFLRADYDRAAQVHDQMAARITSMSMEQNAPDRVILFKEAEVPANPDEALPYKKMALAALGAFCLPFFCAVGAEHLFRRVSTRDQLESAGNVLVVGEVTTLPRRSRTNNGQGKGLRELQLFEESVESLWMYLRLSESIKSIAVTSAVSGEGKTSLAVQLAISIAGTTGARTLLIDGDMRSPDVHRLLGIDCGPGLVDLLNGETEIHDAIETGFSDQLHVLTAGRTNSSPSRLMQGNAFPRLIEKLKASYEYIVIDTPPILAASEALLMARCSDAAVLCVRRDFSRVSQVREAQWRLKGTKVNYAGAVLSGIPMRNYARRYGEYYGSDEVQTGSNA